MLDFLATATLSDVAEKVPVSRKGVTTKQRNPERLAIRLFRDGSVYPSAELVEKFQLEYANKGAITGNGFDVIDTALYPSFNVGKRILIINPVPKALPKVDLFGSTTYKEDGTPKSNVMTQGAKTYGADELIPMVEEIYGITFYKPAVDAQDGVEASEEVEGVEFVDLALVVNPVTNEPWAKAITYIPKKVSRGKDAGQVTTQRRENAQFYALLPLSSIQPAEETAKETGAELPDNQQEAEDVETEEPVMNA